MNDSTETIIIHFAQGPDGVYAADGGLFTPENVQRHARMFSVVTRPLLVRIDSTAQRSVTKLPKVPYGMTGCRVIYVDRKVEGVISSGRADGYAYDVEYFQMAGRTQVDLFLSTVQIEGLFNIPTATSVVIK